ncbi:unnamed protein product [Dibothriocephalus latus]|uniref:Uncharacterized protein n=1 Tax=Dibothriocephalus latus TaxID=60516 RepID=A0A3P7QU22_DIBLA|nr:unnamed protein product [Dibothriocephalus latus]
MSWKTKTTGPFLRLPRPYPRKLYPEKLRHPEQTDSRCVDELIRALPKPRPGARILHILEVSSEFQGVGNIPSKCKDLNPYYCQKRQLNPCASFHCRSYQPPPIAYWADPRSFMTLLVHPKMFKNHSPTFVATAFNRLHAALTWPEKVFPKFPIATYRQEAKALSSFKRPAGMIGGKYSRIRKPRGS